jgi:hypothetical protein
MDGWMDKLLGVCMWFGGGSCGVGIGGEGEICGLRRGGVSYVEGEEPRTCEVEWRYSKDGAF